jgi:preprotein translocase subunit YajC
MDPKIMLLFYGAIFIVIYFFFIRPQSQKVKKEKLFIDELQKGDKVITTNGIHGTIDRVEDSSFMIEIDKNVKIRIEKSGISSELTQALRGKDTEKKPA